MERLTRGQWKAYIVLASVLSMLLVLLILRPLAKGTPEPMDSSALQQQMEKFGDEMADSARTYKEAWRQRYGRWKREDGRWKKEEGRGKNAIEKKEYAKPAIPTIELNSADTTELKLLPGIGSAFARRIVKYRALLGGYARKEQLMEVYGMDEQRYSGIVGYIVVDSSAIVKMDINNATAQELKRHPYLDYYQARAITDFRKKVGTLKNRDDLSKVNLLDDSTINKISPYIKYN